MSKYNVLSLSYRVQEKFKQDIPRLKAAKRSSPCFLLIKRRHFCVEGTFKVVLTLGPLALLPSFA